MSEKSKEFVSAVIGSALLGALLVLFIWHSTSAEAWYAGEHTQGCDGSDNCGCYEKMVSLDREKANHSNTGKR